MDARSNSWAFQAEQPLSVVSTVPEDRETGVPLDTGIEITFDQDGVTSAASHVTITPKTPGHFEQHGRVLVFVPDRLKSRTLYTVTVAKGVTTSLTAAAMDHDVRFQFETSGPGQATESTAVQLATDLFESGTASRPVISVWTDAAEDQPPPESAKVDVYRLAGLDAGIEAFRQIRSGQDWAQWSTHGVPTTDLPKVLSVEARIRGGDGGETPGWLTLPEPLAAGWYLVELPAPTHPIQAVLQVTDIASYAVVSDTKTLVWVNDLTTGGPVSGATVGAAGAPLGKTGADGVMAAPTPIGLSDQPSTTCVVDCIGVVTISADDGRAAFVPASGSLDQPSLYEGYGGYGTASSRWLSFQTDRTTYRRTDTVNVWGMVRDRTTGKVPAALGLRVVADSESGSTGPPISRLDVTPRPTGVFSASVPLTDLPEGWYSLHLVSGAEVIATTGFRVDRILKPAYRLGIETGHRAYVAGERIKATVRASFYEGSPVPGLSLRVENGSNWRASTDATGTAIVRTTARLQEHDRSGEPEYQQFTATPRRAEEGGIAGASQAVLVFPSNWTITANSTISEGRVHVTGALHELDRDGLEAQLASGIPDWEVDPRGDPVANATVTATFVEFIPIRTRIGTTYDFIEKKAVPLYSYDTRERPAGTVRIRTDAQGQFTASISDSGDRHDYEVRLRATDPDGLTARAMTGASASLGPDEQGVAPVTLVASGDVSGDYAVGDRIDLTMRDDAHPADDHSRYLFHVARLGLRDWTVQASPRFESTFDPDDVPNVSITGVRFTGTGYVVADTYEASFRSELRRIDTDLTTDQPRYGPRDTVNVSIRTRDAAGKPVAASVVVRAIDDKLFDILAAEDVDPLAELYTPVESGIRSSYVSHRAPTSRPGGGDTGGGGGDEGRELFRDALLFKVVDTGADGRGSVTFRLSDDLTSWRVMGSAYTADIGAGEGSVKVAVGLPFFVDASIAPEYLAADRPTILVRGFGTSLAPNAKVTFSVTSDSLGFRTGPVVSTSFKDVPIRLPRLSLGRHSVTITARTGSGAAARTDRLTRTFDVVRSRLTTARSSYVEPSGPAKVSGGADLTTVIVSDASAGRYVPLLTDIAGGGGVRLERALAADVASSLLVDRFDVPEGTVPSSEFVGVRYQNDNGGLGLVPVGGSDLDRTALVAIVAPDRFDRVGLEGYLTTIHSNPRQTRERRMYALAGLAGLGAPVLPQIRLAAADQDLTIRERLMIGLGAAAIGDAATARSIDEALYAEYGERTPEWARLRVGKSAADSSEGTALMAVLAAATGDPRAPAFWAYVEANPTASAVHDLHAVGYVERVLERLPAQPVSFAYTVDGTRIVVDLAAGETFTMDLTAPQLRTLRVEPVTGPVGVAARWREPVKPSAFKKDPDITISRSVTPSGTVGSGDLVTVRLRVRFGPQAPDGCSEVTELVPSGLVPVGGLADSPYFDDSDVPDGVTLPYAQVAQRVSFCAEKTKRDRTADLRYVARVITAGTYAWEPALVESKTSAGRAALTPTTTVHIR